MKYFNRPSGENSKRPSSSAGSAGQRRVFDNTTTRVVAGVGAFSIFALTAGVTQGLMSPVSALPQAADAAKAVAVQASSTSNPDQLGVVVGNALTITGDAKGKFDNQGFAVATNVSGSGDTTVKIPVGPSKMVNVSNFSPLPNENGSISYQIDNSGNQVQNLLATGGQFQGTMPVEIETQLTVNGKSVDPNSATSISGDVVVNWVFKNKTSKPHTITYTNANNELTSETVNIGVPFTVALKGTFGNGWTNMVAPWANMGFSSGEEITGGGTLGSDTLTLSMSAFADNAALPVMSGSFVPTDSNGSITSGLDSAASAGTKVTGILDGEAVPLLLAVQGGLGKASGELSGILQKKVDPILELLAKLKLDPNKADNLLDVVGADLVKASNTLIGANTMIDGGAAKLAGAVADLGSPAAMEALDALIKSMESVDSTLGFAIKGLEEAAKYLPEFVTILGTKVPSAVGILICPSGTGSSCTVGQVLEADTLGKLNGTCSSVAGTNTAWGNTVSGVTVQSAMTAAIAATTGTTQQQLQQLQTLLNAQAAAQGNWNVSDCQNAAATVSTALEGLFGELGAIGDDINNLLPLLQDLDEGLEEATAALVNLEKKLPQITAALDKPCSPQNMANFDNCGLVQQLEISAAAGAEAQEQLDVAIISLVNKLKVPVNELFAIANALGRAAKPLEDQINGLPAVINELANGPLGYFVDGAESLSAMAANLTDGASKMAAVNKRVDEMFHAGAGFPYGAPATGTGTATAATYSFSLDAPTTVTTSTTAIVGYAIALLLLAIALSIWLTRRASRQG